MRITKKEWAKTKGVVISRFEEQKPELLRRVLELNSSAANVVVSFEVRFANIALATYSTTLKQFTSLQYSTKNEGYIQLN